MFTRKPKNALESVVFTDGKIIEHYPHGNDHFVELVDYCGKTMKIRFTDASRVEEYANFSTREGMDATFERDDARWTLIFKDDDREPILVVGYRDTDLVLNTSS